MTELPIKINTLYSSKMMYGLGIKILKFTRRKDNEFLLTVDWYRKEDKTHKWMSMDVEQEMVVNTDTFEKEWKELPF